jgi:hypothetical protein
MVDFNHSVYLKKSIIGINKTGQERPILLLLVIGPSDIVTKGAL